MKRKNFLLFLLFFCLLGTSACSVDGQGEEDLETKTAKEVAAKIDSMNVRMKEDFEKAAKRWRNGETMKSNDRGGILEQGNEFSDENEPELNDGGEYEFYENEELVDENPFGKDVEKSSKEYGGIGVSSSRSIVSDAKFDDLIVEEETVVALRVSVDSDGKVLSAILERTKTSTSNSSLVNEVRRRVISDVRYSKFASGKVANLLYVARILP